MFSILKVMAIKRCGHRPALWTPACPQCWFLQDVCVYVCPLTLYLPGTHIGQNRVGLEGVHNVGLRSTAQIIPNYEKGRFPGVFLVDTQKWCPQIQMCPQCWFVSHNGVHKGTNLHSHIHTHTHTYTDTYMYIHRETDTHIPHTHMIAAKYTCRIQKNLVCVTPRKLCAASVMAPRSC